MFHLLISQVIIFKFYDNDLRLSCYFIYKCHFEGSLQAVNVKHKPINSDTSYTWLLHRCKSYIFWSTLKKCLIMFYFNEIDMAIWLKLISTKWIKAKSLTCSHQSVALRIKYVNSVDYVCLLNLFWLYFKEHKAWIFYVYFWRKAFGKILLNVHFSSP